MKRILAAPGYSVFGSLALLLLRVVAGSAFMLHGWGKIQHPLNWMGPESPVPGILQALAAVSEFGGGLAWILGLLTPLASIGMACTMAVAFSLHTFVFHDAFVAMEKGKGSSEPAAGYFCIAMVLLALGPGRFALDRLLFGPRDDRDLRTDA